MLAPNIVRGLLSGFHDAGERVAGVDFVVQSQTLRLRRDQRGGASAPDSNLDEPAAFEVGGLLDKPPQLEATVLVDERREFDSRIGGFERLIEIPRAIRCAWQHDLVARSLVENPGHIAKMDATIARELLKRRFYEEVKGNNPPLKKVFWGDAVSFHNTVLHS